MDFFYLVEKVFQNLFQEFNNLVLTSGINNSLQSQNFEVGVAYDEACY